MDHSEIQKSAGLKSPIRNQLFINGQFVDSESGETLATMNPHDNSIITEVAMAGRADVDKAVAAAEKALPAWSRMSAMDRGRILLKVADLVEQNAEELARLDAAADLDALEKAEHAAHRACLQAAQQVSAQRQKAAKPLAKAVTAAMQQLGMQGGRFEVSLQTLDAPAQHGLEEVAFLVAGHEGSTPRPVGKVASGGELSRIALAIAVTTSELGEAGTLIFDEVDSGVGGAVAETVGRLMKQLGQHRQVLAVTHLPQVAACADHHLLVSKAAAQGQVSSQVRAVSGEERVSEIARMLGGEKLSATTLAHAREMLGTPQN